MHRMGAGMGRRLLNTHASFDFANGIELELIIDLESSEDAIDLNEVLTNK